MIFGVEVTVLLAWLTLLVGVPFSAAVALMLRKGWRDRRHLGVLQERYMIQVGVTIVVLFFGVIFVNNDQLVPPMDVDTTKLITRLAILGLAIVPAVGWILLDRSLKRKDR